MAAMRRAHTKPGSAAVALVVCLIALGCSSSPRHGLTIHDSPRGSVYLEQIRDASLQATHPIALEAGIIARALHGIQVRDVRNTLQALFASRPEAVRAFSDEEADFIAPFISDAFAKASPDQRIGFWINQTTSPPDSKKEGAAPGPPEPALTLAPKEITSGVLLAYGHSLQIHLTRFRSGLQERSMIDGPNRHYSDQTGLTGRKLVFFPKEAQRPEAFRVGETEFPTLVIDYDLLARLPEQPAEITPATPGRSVPGPGNESQAGQTPESITKIDSEVEALKEEMRSLRQKLEQQDAEMQKLKKPAKKKPTPPSREQAP